MSRRITDDSLITNCTFGKRTATAALGKNIHFQFVAVNYLAHKSGQKTHRIDQFLRDSWAVSVLSS